MDFRELVTTRASVRRYEQRPVEEDLVRQVLEAARLAPTADNRQPFRLLVVTDEPTRTAMAGAYSRKWFYTAPVIIVACAVAGEAWVRKDGVTYVETDVAIVMDHLILQAADLGLGTCWIADFHPAVVREVLHLPAELEPLVLTPLGYPAQPARTKRRRSLRTLVQWGAYS